ncbi:F-box protein CPR1-like [Apium graveolens]|uniref:F-box protein CPR1-like n=1 Tax=Apium graveolens TaxID=4045 RepID=UPI003D7A79E8
MALPYELFCDEVLCRLPVKYLLRCRCVSKEWCSTIDSNAFVKKHLKKSIECNPYGDGVIFTVANKFHFTDLESLYANDVTVLEINDPLKTVLSGTVFVGASNCLACFRNKVKNEFLLLNPSTRKYKKIPSMPHEFASWFEMEEVPQCGFGYDQVNDNYKVVSIADLLEQGNPDRFGVMVLVYSLKTNNWTQIHNIPSNYYLSIPLGMYKSGVLHWSAIKSSPGICSEYIIVGFDLGLEQFKEVPSPAVDGKFVVPGGGSFWVLEKCTNSRMTVWHSNSNGTQNLWYKAFSVEQPGAIGSFEFIRPVAFSNRGNDILLEVDNTKLVWYDPETKVVKNVRIHGIPTKFSLHLYREGLLQLTDKEQLLKTPSEEKKEKKQQKKRDNFLSKGFKLKL